MVQQGVQVAWCKVWHFQGQHGAKVLHQVRVAWCKSVAMVQTARCAMVQACAMVQLVAQCKM